ncbi:MAG: hypothetical protein R2724_35295, partial [Bryobacterales bacterium]
GLSGSGSAGAGVGSGAKEVGSATASSGGPASPVRAADHVELSPRGRSLILWSEEPVRRARKEGKESTPCFVSLWDLRGGKMGGTFEAECTAECPTCTRGGLLVQLSSEEEILFVADHSTFRAFQLPGGGKIYEKPLPPAFTGYDLGPGDRRVLLRTEDGQGELLDAKSGKRTGKFQLVEDGIGRAFGGSWDSSGRYLVLSGDEAYSRSLPPMQIRDGRTGALLRTIKVEGAASPHFIGTGSRFVIFNDEGLFGIADAATGATDVLRKGELAPPGPRQSWGSLSPDDRLFAISGADSRLEVWDLGKRTRKELLAPVESEWTSYPQISPDGRVIALVRDRAVEMVDVDGASPGRKIPLAEGELSLSVHGEWGNDGLFHVRRGAALVAYGADAKERSRRDLGDADAALSWSADRRFLVLSGRDVRVIRMRDFQEIRIALREKDGRIEGEVAGGADAAAPAAFFGDEGN